MVFLEATTKHLNVRYMQCEKCKNEIDNDSKFCEFCGANIDTHQIPYQSQIRSKFGIKKYIEKNMSILVIIFLFILVIMFIIIAIDLHNISTHIAPESIFY